MRTIRSSVDLNADDRRRIEEDWPEGADTALVEARDGWLEVRFVRTPKRFERIRRITGYLVGDMSRWNNAKKAEERDRVRHWTGLRDSQDSQDGPGNPENHGIPSTKDSR